MEKACTVPFETLRALGGTVKQAMMEPDSEVQTASFTEGDVVFSVE